MKKDFKRALSKILAGAMLITSSFSSVTAVAAAEGDTADSKYTKVFEQDFTTLSGDVATSYSAIDGRKLNFAVTDGAKAEYSSGLKLTGKVDNEFKFANGSNISAGEGKDTVVYVDITPGTTGERTYFQLKSGNDVVVQLRQGDKAVTTHAVPNGAVTGDQSRVWTVAFKGEAKTVAHVLTKDTEPTVTWNKENAIAGNGIYGSNTVGQISFAFVIKPNGDLKIYGDTNFSQELKISTSESYGVDATNDITKLSGVDITGITFGVSGGGTNENYATYNKLGIAYVEADEENPDEPNTSGSAVTTEAQTGDNTEAQTEANTEKQTDGNTEAQTEKQTEANTEKQTEAGTEKQTEGNTENTTAASQENTTEASSESPKYDMAEAADAEKVADDNEAASSTTSKKFLITGEGTVTKNASGSVTLTAPADGSSKLVAKFPKVYTDGTVTFETKVNLGEAFATANQGIVELWGTGNASGKEVLAVRVADGQYQFSVLGTKHGVAAFKAGEADVKIAVNLKDKTAECYINGTKVADENGPVTLAESTIAAITEISHAAYFAKNGSATEILSMAVAHQADEQPPVPVTGSGLKSEVAPVGDANLDDLKAGDKIAVTYSLDDEIAGINNYTMFINFDPTILTFDSAEKPADPYTGYVTYNTTTALGTLPLVPGDLIEAQAKVKTGASNPDYAGTKVPATDSTTAAEVGRIKLAAVAGLNGASTNKEDSANVATTAGGKLFTIYFTVKEGTKGGSTTVSLDPVAGSKANELFFQKPVDGQGSSPVDIGTEADVEAAVNENVVEVPVKVDAFEYTYEGDGVKIVIDAEGTVTVEGDNVEGLSGETMTITLKKGTIAPADFIAHMAAATQPEGVTVTDASEGDVKKVTIAKGDKSVTFTIVESNKGEPEPPVTGGVTITVDGIEIGLEKGTTGLVATVAKGIAKEVEGGAYVPLVGGTKTLAELTSADFTGATVDYDAQTFTATLTVDGTSYKLEFFKFGDVNNDTFINVADALQVVKCFNEEITFTEKQNFIADVNKDTFVNVGDALLIVKRFNDASTAFPAEADN